MDSRILSLDLHVNKDFDLKFDKLDIFTLTAYDTLTTSVDIGIENGLRGRIGIGTSFYYNNLLLYVIPNMGFRHGKGFVSSKIGTSLKMFSKLSASLQYEVGSDYDALEAGLNMKISNEMEMQAKYSYKKDESDFYVGIGIYF